MSGKRLADAKLPLRWLILAFAAGVAWLQSQAELPGWTWLWYSLPFLVLTTFLPKNRPWRKLALLLISFLVGFGYAALRAEWRLADSLPLQWEGRDVVLEGRVVGLPETTPRSKRIVLAVSSVKTRDAEVPTRVSLSLFADTTGVLPALTGGDRVRVTARLYRPQGQYNPGGFDYEAWLLVRGIRAQGWARAYEVLALPGPFNAAAGLDALRDTMRTHLLSNLSAAPYAGVVVALALGDQNAIADPAWELFRRTGVTHLMSISGLHVTLLGWLVYLLASWLWRRSPSLAQRFPARLVAGWTGLLVSMAYVTLSGFGIPAQRTLFMLLTATLALSLGRLHSTSRVLGAALLLVLLFDPWAVLSVGFWLSFGAVAILLYAGSDRLAPAPWWQTWGRAQWAVTVGLAPILLLLFNQLSLVSPLANGLAIPLISLLAVPLSILAVLLPWQWPATLAHGVIQVVMEWLHWLDAGPAIVWNGATPSLGAMLLAAAGVLALLLPRGVPGRWLGLILLLPLMLVKSEQPEMGEFRLQVMDVGQGLATLVSTRNHHLLYDAGPTYASGDDAGARVVVPALHRQGIHHLDGLVISHDDRDHSGGAPAVQASHRPAWLLSSLDGREPGRLSHHGQIILDQARQPLHCIKGMQWRWDQVQFDVLYPPERYYDNPGFNDNERSCVVKVSAATGTMLLTGDLGRLGEMTLTDTEASALRADVLVVGHHGSGSSSSKPFIQAVSPHVALISVGRRNPYGHPDPEVLRRFHDAGVRVMRTDRDGAIRMDFAATGQKSQVGRSLGRRYWQGV